MYYIYILNTCKQLIYMYDDRDGGSRGPPDFGSSVNAIWNRGGQILPTNYYSPYPHPNPTSTPIFRPGVISGWMFLCMISRIGDKKGQLPQRNRQKIVSRYIITTNYYFQGTMRLPFWCNFQDLTVSAIPFPGNLCYCFCNGKTMRAVTCLFV